MIDELKGRRVAAQHALLTVGTLGILERSAAEGWIDFDQHIASLRATNFRIDDRLIAEARGRLKAKRP